MLVIRLLKCPWRDDGSNQVPDVVKTTQEDSLNSSRTSLFCGFLAILLDKAVPRPGHHVQLSADNTGHGHHGLGLAQVHRCNPQHVILAVETGEAELCQLGVLTWHALWHPEVDSVGVRVGVHIGTVLTVHPKEQPFTLILFYTSSLSKLV